MNPRYPVRYGRISSLRMTEIRVAGDPGTVTVLGPGFRADGRPGEAVLARGGATFLRPVEAAGLPGTAAIAAGPATRVREIVLAGMRGFAHPAVTVRPDVSLGVDIRFEEV